MPRVVPITRRATTIDASRTPTAAGAAARTSNANSKLPAAASASESSAVGIAADGSGSDASSGRDARNISSDSSLSAAADSMRTLLQGDSRAQVAPSLPPPTAVSSASTNLQSTVAPLSDQLNPMTDRPNSPHSGATTRRSGGAATHRARGEAPTHELLVECFLWLGSDVMLLVNAGNLSGSASGGGNSLLSPRAADGVTPRNAQAGGGGRTSSAAATTARGELNVPALAREPPTVMPASSLTHVSLPQLLAAPAPPSGAAGNASLTSPLPLHQHHQRSPESTLVASIVSPVGAAGSRGGSASAMPGGSSPRFSRGGSGALTSPSGLVRLTMFSETQTSFTTVEAAVSADVSGGAAMLGSASSTMTTGALSTSAAIPSPMHALRPQLDYRAPTSIVPVSFPTPLTTSRASFSYQLMRSSSNSVLASPTSGQTASLPYADGVGGGGGNDAASVCSTPMSPRDRVRLLAGGGSMPIALRTAIAFIRAELRLWQAMATPDAELREALGGTSAASLLPAPSAGAATASDVTGEIPVRWRLSRLLRQGVDDAALLDLLCESGAASSSSTGDDNGRGRPSAAAAAIAAPAVSAAPSTTATSPRPLRIATSINSSSSALTPRGQLSASATSRPVSGTAPRRHAPSPPQLQLALVSDSAASTSSQLDDDTGARSSRLTPRGSKASARGGLALSTSAHPLFHINRGRHGMHDGSGRPSSPLMPLASSPRGITAARDAVHPPPKTPHVAAQVPDAAVATGGSSKHTPPTAVASHAPGRQMTEQRRGRDTDAGSHATAVFALPPSVDASRPAEHRTASMEPSRRDHATHPARLDVSPLVSGPNHALDDPPPAPRAPMLRAAVGQGATSSSAAVTRLAPVALATTPEASSTPTQAPPPRAHARTPSITEASPINAPAVRAPVAQHEGGAHHQRRRSNPMSGQNSTEKSQRRRQTLSVPQSYVVPPLSLNRIARLRAAGSPQTGRGDYPDEPLLSSRRVISEMLVAAAAAEAEKLKAEAGAEAVVERIAPLPNKAATSAAAARAEAEVIAWVAEQQQRELQQQLHDSGAGHRTHARHHHRSHHRPMTGVGDDRDAFEDAVGVPTQHTRASRTREQRAASHDATGHVARGAPGVEERTRGGRELRNAVETADRHESRRR